MLLRVLLFALFALTSHQSVVAQEVTERRGVTSRMLDMFRGNPRKVAKDGTVRTRFLQLKMEVTPVPFKLEDTRQLQVSLELTNRSKKFLDLEFPTAQRIEVLVRDRLGRVVTQWSEDQAFAQSVSHVVMNPGERLEYTASVATRDMTAGEEHTVEAFFPGFEDLRVQKVVVPQP